MATLLFLGASVSQVPAIRHARAAGHRVVAVDGDPNALGFADASDCVAVDFTHVEEVVAAGRAHRVDGVLAVSSDRAVVPAAAVAEALGLPGIGVDVARGLTDKPTMRARLGRAGVAQPEWAVVRSDDDARAAVEGMRLPAVLKPADSGGQRGLFLIRQPDDVLAHLHETLSFSPTDSAMLEEYVDGIELNGILVVRDGSPTLITLSDRLRPPGLGFGVGWIHQYPSSLDDAVLERAREVAFDAVRALGLRDGIAFPQLIADGDDVRIVEIAARIAAGQMADLVRFGTGVELFDVAIAQALGEPVPDGLVLPKSTRPIAIRFLTASPGVLPLGKVTAISGLDDVRAAPGVLAAGLYFDVGANITAVQVDADRRGYVVATGESSADALARADAAARLLVVKTLRGVSGGRLLPALAGLAAVAALVAAVALAHSVLRPRLISDTVSSQAGRVRVYYAFNEPVRALLLVNGKPATALSAWQKKGQLVWRRGGTGHYRIRIEGIDRAGHRVVAPV